MNTSIRRPFRLLAAAAVASAVAVAGLAALPGSSAHAAGRDPSANIEPSPGFPSSCYDVPTGTACQNGVIASLNHARAVMGLPAYALPSGFAAMAPKDQLLVLSNLDRAVYGLPAANGFNATLNAASQQAAQSGGDPVGPSSVEGVRTYGWASNWAGGYPSALEAYYSWMYDDGPGSANGDCQRAGDSGCWGHRHSTLIDGGSTPLSMGVGYAGSGSTGYYPAWTELYWLGASPVSAIPVVTGVSPASGPGGTKVTITGYGLKGARSVAFGSTGVAPSATGPTSLVVVAPRGTGAPALTVGNNGGTSAASLASRYTFTRTGAGTAGRRLVNRTPADPTPPPATPTDPSSSDPSAAPTTGASSDPSQDPSAGTASSTAAPTAAATASPTAAPTSSASSATPTDAATAVPTAPTAPTAPTSPAFSAYHRGSAPQLGSTGRAARAGAATGDEAAPAAPAGPLTSAPTAAGPTTAAAPRASTATPWAAWLRLLAALLG